MTKDALGDIGHAIGAALDGASEINLFRMGEDGSACKHTLADIHLRQARRLLTVATHDIEVALDRLRQERANKETAP